MRGKRFISEKLAYFVIIIFVLIIAALAIKYFADDEKGAKPKDSDSKTRKEGIALLKSPDGNVIVVVPAKAKPAASGLYVNKIDEDPLGTDNRVSDVYNFGPSGTIFEQPVEARVKYFPEAGCPKRLWFYHFNDDGTLKEVVPHKDILCGINSVSFDISSFSIGYAAQGQPTGRGNCEEWDRGGDGACGETPVIDSISPQTVNRGQSFTVRGNYLTRTVQFIDSSNNRNSYNWANGITMNERRTEVSVPVPNELPAGRYRVRTWTSPTLVSNEVEINIEGSPTGTSSGTVCPASNNQNTGNYPTLTYPSCIDQLDDPRGIRSALAKEDLGIFTVCRDVAWMIRNTNRALSCSSDFTYNGIPAATWRGWVENEAKILDDACIGVCHPGLECEKQPDSLDRDKLVQALENYLKNCIRRKGISCICNPNPADPICGHFVQYMGGINIGAGSNCNPNNPLSPTSISSSWNPKLTDNGWFPQLSPDGRYVTYGFGENWVTDLQTGEERSFTIRKGDSFSGYWIKPDTYTFINLVSQRDNTAERYEVKAGEWVARKTNDNPSLVAGNQFVAADSHWASWIADTHNNNFRVAYDNSILEAGVGGALSISEDWVVHATDPDNSAIQVWRNGQKSAVYSPQTPLFSMNVNKGYITYGGYGPVHGINPEGQDVDLTVSPWRWEGVGGVVFVNNQPWVYTSSWDNTNNKGYIFIRPWGQNSGVVIDAAAVSVHVVYVNGNFVVAFNGDRGQLQVVKVSANSQRVDLSNPTTANNPNQARTTTLTNPVYATEGSQQSMAFNPTANNWMVVSSRGCSAANPGCEQIQSAIVGNDGVLQTSPPNVVKAGVGGGNKIIFGKDLNKYLVIWGENPTQNTAVLYGRFLSANNVNDGDIFEIDRDGMEWGSFNNNDRLQYDAKNKKFVISYKDVRQGILLITIGADKSITKKVVANAGEGYFLGQVAVNEDKNEYCVNMQTATPEGLRTQALRSVNAATGEMSAISTATRGIGSDSWITYNTVEKEYFTVFNDGNAYGQALGSECNFQNAKTPFIIQEYARTVAYNQKSNSYAVIGEGSTYENPNPVTIFTHNGNILVKVSPFSWNEVRNGLYNPMIEANTNDGTFAAVTSRDYELVRFVANIGFNSNNNNGGSGGGTTATNPSSNGQPLIIAQKELGPGTFPDVVFYNSKLWLAVQQDAQLKLYNFAPDLSNQQVTTIPINGGQAFPRLTVSGNILWLSYRVGDLSSGRPESIKLWRSDSQTTEDLGGGLGNNPVALGNGYIAWQKDGKVQRRLLTGGEIVAVRDQLPTGISRILPDGSVKMVDEDRTAIPNYYDPSWAADMTVAEDNDNGVVYFFNNNIGALSRLWQGATTWNPKAASDGNGNYAITAWSPRTTGDTVRVAVIKKA